MYSQTDINQIVEKFVGLVSEEIPVKAVWLFGSYATGNAHEYSDIDLAIVSDEFSGSRFDDRKKMNKFVAKTSVDLELHPYKTDQFNEEDAFVRIILSTGKRLV